MDKRVRFETKEEGNARRVAAFLALTPAQRFAWFLRSFEGRAAAVEHPGNFIIRRRRDPVR